MADDGSERSPRQALSVETLLAHLAELRQLTILEDESAQSFRARAYDRALRRLRDTRADLALLSEAELQQLEGVGTATARKVREFFTTGRIAKLEQLRARFPPAVRQLAQVPGLGPKTLARLRAELGIENLDQLRVALGRHALRDLPGLGRKTEAALIRGLQRLGRAGKDARQPIARVLPEAQLLVAELAALPGVVHAQYCGSLRRLRSTVADVDIVVAATDPRPVLAHFAAVSAGAFGSPSAGGLPDASADTSGSVSGSASPVASASAAGSASAGASHSASADPSAEASRSGPPGASGNASGSASLVAAAVDSTHASRSATAAGASVSGSEQPARNAGAAPAAAGDHRPAGVPAEPGARAVIVSPRGVQVDLRIVPPEQLGAALLHFTGSQAHNIKLRGRAAARGWLLNEYGLTDERGTALAAATEEEIYTALELQPIPPPLREDGGEIEAAARGELPEPVTLADLRGDLHLHSDASGDGRSTLAEMVAEAAARGFAYLAITDHGQDLAMVGVDRERLLAQRAELHRLAAAYPRLHLLHGVELNIGPDGSLDYDAAFRASFDWCVAAVHTGFNLDRAAQTRRIIRAMEDPAVNVIGHLTGRKIGHRPGIDLDLDAVLAAAARTGTALEINSDLRRLDATSAVLRRARAFDVTIVVSSDAHHRTQFDHLQWGVLHAQRGWVDRSRIANTWPAERFLAWASAQRRRP